MKIINIFSSILVLGLTALFTSCNDNDDTTAVPSIKLPDTITINGSNLYPEGIVYSENQEVFYAGSVGEGKIITVDINGNQQDFAEDETLISILGLIIDETNNRLIVCNSDPGTGVKTSSATAGQLAQIIMYDLSNGDKINTIDLGSLVEGAHIANDLTLDAEGNIYVTDSFSPVIYKVDTLGNASVLINNPSLFSVPAGAFGLNGIVYHSDNYLIVGKYNEGKLFKILLNDTNDITEITLDGVVNTVDGLLLRDDNTLILASNNITGEDFEEAIYEISTINDWTTAAIINTSIIPFGTFPTALEIIEDDLYVIYSSLSTLFGLFEGAAIVEEYPIQKITF